MKKYGDNAVPHNLMIISDVKSRRIDSDYALPPKGLTFHIG